MVGVLCCPVEVSPPPLQATGMWSWSQWLLDKAKASGKVPLLMNLDETSVPLEFTHARGNVVNTIFGRKIKDLPKQKASRTAIRCFFTHVAIICNDSAIQPLLPQVLFIAANHLPWQLWSAIQASLPKNVFVRRQKSGWSNMEQHQIILRVLKLALGPVLPGRQPILSFDCAPIHLHPDVIALLGELDIWWYLIPKKLTWLLQPCDTHAFAKYKRYIRRLWMDKLASSSGRRNVYEIVQIVVGAIRHVLQGIKWNYVFQENGLTEDMKATSKYILNQLEWKELPPIVARPPSMDMLSKAWPANRRLPVCEIFTSMGLEPPVGMPAVVGAAPQDSILAPSDDGEDQTQYDDP